MPDSLPDWIFDFMPLKGGYFIGNVSPARMDFRWFCLGNCIAILSSLATPEQSIAIMDLIESRWQELIGFLLSVCFVISIVIKLNWTLLLSVIFVISIVIKLNLTLLLSVIFVISIVIELNLVFAFSYLLSNYE